MANKPNPNAINPEFVERYQLELNKNPRSRVFAPLAEAYRKMGLLEEAKRICRFGTQAHPDFAGGHVAFAKVLLDLKNPEEALKHLEAAAKLSPDNLLAHNLLGETLIEVRRPKEALKAFKMVLFLDPDNTRANQAVRKWEFLTADDYGDDVFSMKPIFKDDSAKENAEEAVDEELRDLLTESGFSPKSNSGSSVKDMRMDLQVRHQRALERAVSLADAFTVRNDLDAALKVLEDARRLLGPMNEIESRHKLLLKRIDAYKDQDDFDDDVDEEDEADFSRVEVAPEALEMPFDPDAPVPLGSSRKREVLELLLQRINTRRSLA